MRRLAGIILLAFVIYVAYKAFSSPFYSSIILQYFLPQTNVIIQEVSKSRLLSPLLLPVILQETSINEHLSTKALDSRLEVKQVDNLILVYIKGKVNQPISPITLHEYIDVNVFVEGEIQRFKKYNKEIASSTVPTDEKSIILGSGCNYSNPCTISINDISLGKITSINVEVPGGTVSEVKKDITIREYTVVSGMITIKITDANLKYLGEIIYRF